MKFITVTLIDIGTNPGPFDIYLNSNVSPTFNNVPANSLIHGYVCEVPDDTVTVKVVSDGVCVSETQCSVPVATPSPTPTPTITPTVSANCIAPSFNAITIFQGSTYLITYTINSGQSCNTVKIEWARNSNFSDALFQVDAICSGSAYITTGDNTGTWHFRISQICTIGGTSSFGYRDYTPGVSPTPTPSATMAATPTHTPTPTITPSRTAGVTSCPSDFFTFNVSIPSSRTFVLPMMGGITGKEIKICVDGSLTVHTWNTSDSLDNYKYSIALASGTHTIGIGTTSNSDYSKTTITGFVDSASSGLITEIASWGSCGFKSVKCSNFTSMTTIPSGSIPTTSMNNTDFKSMFSYCYDLTAIPESIFYNFTSISNDGFYETFSDCHSLAVIPAGLFTYHTNITEFYGTFRYCSSVTSIPSTLFAANTAVTLFKSTFSFCSGLLSIPSALFSNNTAVTGFLYTFVACSSVTSIPSTLFNNNALVTSFTHVFNGIGATSIPSTLFNNNPLVTDFSAAFMATPITSIPSTLFQYNVNVTDFSLLFWECASLTSIPSGLFSTNILVQTFNHTFAYCHLITAIPEGIFDTNTLVTSFSGVFKECELISSMSTGLFVYNTLATDFSYAFYFCTRLTLTPWIFKLSIQTGNRFDNQSVDFSYTFFRGQMTNGYSAGTAPYLWEEHNGLFHSFTKDKCFGGAGNESLTNYSEIPYFWRT